VAVDRGSGRGRHGLGRFRSRRRRRGQLGEQRLEEGHLLRIELLGRAPEQPPQQVLQLVLELLDRAVVLRLLLQQLLPLGAEQFHFLTQLLEFGSGGSERWGTVRGHA